MHRYAQDLDVYAFAFVCSTATGARTQAGASEEDGPMYWPRASVQ